ncbi:MAG: hypothetical protein DMG65_06635 [Candidatus Angelobacter sp. Gp1-AA117]|nr:MAG: hypothetical protein DMG65_06635 [Candidatus Angelobacter sp. Gp1-AA117]
MKVRKEQTETLQQAADRDYAMRLLYFLQDQFPDAAEHEQATLREGIRGQIAKARSYGFLTERQIAAYVISAWLLGEDFDHEFPAVQQILRPGLTPVEKSTQLEQFTRDIFDQLKRSV